MKHMRWVVALGLGGVACGGTAVNDGTAGAAGAPQMGTAAGGDSSPDEPGGSTGETSEGGSSGNDGAAPGGGVAGSESGAGGEPEAPPAAWDHSWDVVVHSTNHATMSADVCDGLRFTLAFPTIAGASRAVASREGQARDLELYRQADGSLLAASTQSSFLPLGSACNASLSLSNLRLQLDHGKLVGSAAGKAQHIMNSDVYEPQYAVDLAFAGTTDSTAPSLHTPTAALSPIDPLTFDASEALSSAEVVLNSASAPIPLAFSGLAFGTGDFASVQLSTNQVLPFSGSWVLAGSGEDYAGHALQLGQTITTIPDPGVAAQDGFEGPLLALLSSAGAKVTDSTFAVPPISGSRSLLLQPGSSATLHLKRTSAQTALSFKVVDLIPSGAQPLSQQSGGIAAIIGGTHRAYISWPVTGSTAITSTTWATASNAALVQVPLTDPGTDVVVVLAAAASTIGPFGPFGPLYPTHSLLIDDVQMQ